MTGGCPRTRFWSKVTKTDTCWLWQAGLGSSGYGRFAFRGRNDKAHRVAWILTHGEIPDGFHVLHKCDIRGCVNPNHLYLGTNSDNIRDKVERGRSIQSQGERNGNSKLSQRDVEEIRRLYATGEFYQKELAKRYGCNQARISAIVTYRQWRIP